MSLTLKKGRGKGEWWPTKDGSATLKCPKCGKGMSIINHTISSNGQVIPSVVAPVSQRVECPLDNCDFHDYIILEGWLENKEVSKGER